MKNEDEKSESIKVVMKEDKMVNLKEENNDGQVEDERNTNQFELFEEKMRSILFPEPIFSQYITELKTKPSKPVNFPNVDTMFDEDVSNNDMKFKKHLIAQPQYTRYLRTWKKNIVHSKKLTSYLISLRELHLAKLITFIEQIHKNSQYTDLDLYIEDLCFPIHRIILACYAPFIFQKLERTKRKQNPIEKLRLINIDPQSFSTIVDFMYTGIAQPNETNFLPVLNTAIHLFMFDFANSWVELYEHKFTNRTAQMLFRSNIARQYGWSDYIQMLNLALAFDFEHLLISDQFEDIHFEQIRDLIQMNNIGTCSEIVLYLAVLKWLNFNYEERKRYTLDLMRLIRFTNMDESELFACYNPPILPEVINHPEIKAMMADAFNLLLHKNKTCKNNFDEQISKTKKRNFLLANAYKDQPLQLWCYLNDEKRTNMQCLSNQLKKFKNFEQLNENSKKINLRINNRKSDAKRVTIRTRFGDSSSEYSTDLVFSNSPSNSLVSSLSDRDLSLMGQMDSDKLDQKKNLNMAKNFNIADSLQEHKNKLSVLKQKPHLDDKMCLCKEVKHTSVEQCKQERATLIIQRTFRRYLARKFKRSSQTDQKKNLRPKIKVKLFDRNIKDTRIFEKTSEIKSNESKLELQTEDLYKKFNNLKDEKLNNYESDIFENETNINKKRTNKESKQNNFGESFSSSSILKSQSTKSEFNLQSGDESMKISLDRTNTKTEPFSLTELSKKESEINSLSPIISSHINKDEIFLQKPQKITRFGKIILYSDPINQEFSGFYICTGVKNLDGQLIGWQKKFSFNDLKSKKIILPPFDTVMVNHGQNLYLVGGMQTKSYKDFYVSKEIFHFQLSNQKIKAIFSLITPRVQHSCVVAGDRLYVICGCKKLNTPVNTVECLHLMSRTKIKLNSEILKLPGYGRFGQSAVYFRSRLWIIGGIAKIDNNFHLLSEVWILDVGKDNKWIKAKFPVPIAFAGICSVNEESIYVIGGRCVGLNGKLQPSEKVWCYDVSSRRWQQIASLKEPRSNCCCVFLDNRIYTFGGSLENDAEHLRGQTAEFYDLNKPNKGWKMLDENLPISISGQSVTVVSNF